MNEMADNEIRSGKHPRFDDNVEYIDISQSKLIANSPLKTPIMRPLYFCKRGSQDIVKVEKRAESVSVEMITGSQSNEGWQSV